MEYLVSSKLNILNRGNEPTFVVNNGQEVIDLTLGTNRIGDLVSNWHVSDDPSLSDHRYICFQIHNIKVEQSTYRNPKRTNWLPKGKSGNHLAKYTHDRGRRSVR
jgi:hypothetical protein